MKFKVLNWNIGGSNFSRFERQIKAIIEINPDIIVLTEVRNGTSFDKNLDLLKQCNYKVYYTEEFIDNYCVLICVKNHIESRKLKLSGVNARNCVIEININNKVISIIGTYFPSNDRKKIEKKKNHYNELIGILNKISGYALLCGDFNSIYKSHTPKISWFRKWEYSIFENIELLEYKNLADIYHKSNDYTWVGKTGMGHVYDYAFEKKLETIFDFIFINDIDLVKNGLSDHSGIIIYMEEK